jgi:purine-binding chemotaxis protein CheW
VAIFACFQHSYLRSVDLQLHDFLLGPRAMWDLKGDVLWLGPDITGKGNILHNLYSTDGTGMNGNSEYLVFRLGSEEYGIDILKVQEIRGYESVTSIADAAVFIKGLLNLRGVIVPIIDLRIKLHLGAPRYDPRTAVIIVNLGSRVMGMVVDSVSDVISLPESQIRCAPELGATKKPEYLKGLGTLDGRMVILMDIDKLMPPIHAGIEELCAV